MFIKQFRSTQVRVPDPLHPGRRTFEERIYPTGCSGISDNGVEYTADEDGWIDVPHDVGQRLVSFRHPGGERFYQPHEVDEQVRLGALDENEGHRPDAPKRRGRPARAGASA